jgi:PTS system mannose-specific IIA component
MKTTATFILTHEKMAICLQRAVEKILGKQKHLYPYTNLKDSLPVLAEKINQNIADIQPQQIVCFVDLAGGSCWNLANLIRKQHQQTHIVAGVNLPMLVSYFMNLNEVEFQDLMDKVVKDGSRGIVYTKGND